jgi:hypothetical protein
MVLSATARRVGPRALTNARSSGRVNPLVRYPPAVDRVPGDEPLPFDTWSRTSARLLKRTPEEKESILEELGLTPEAWQASEVHWAAALGNDVVAGDFARAEQHGKRCAEELAARPAADETPTPVPPPQLAAVESNATVDISGALREGPALPFVAPLPGGPPPAAALPGSSPSPPTLEVGATMAVSEALRRSGELPFAPPPPPLPTLSLKQYASLTVDIAAAPAQAAETLRRYGVAPSQQGQLEAEWRARLEGPTEREAFERACAEYRAWLATAAR